MKFSPRSDSHNWYSNGNSVNGNGAGRVRGVRYSPQMHREYSVILERPALWSRVFVWLLVGATTSAVIWARLTQLDQAVLATGKLAPKGEVKEIKAPTAGVVREIRVRDGEVVKKDQVLLTFDPTTPKANLQSLTKLRSSLEQENQFYNAALSAEIQGAGGSDLVSLTRLKAALIAENQFYKAQTSGLNSKVGALGEFNANQRRLLAASIAEVQSRVAAAQLQIQELEKQRFETRSQLTTAKNVLSLNQVILNQFAQMAEQGAVSKLQTSRQQQEVLTRQAEVDRLTTEQQRLAIAISQAREQLQNTIALSAKDFLSKIAENQKKMAEIDAQLSQAKQAVEYQELKAPVAGVVFDLKPHSQGFVANTTQTLLTIVPNDNLVASVFLTNRDIGFVHEGMNVDVRIDSFPSTEFGSIKGKIAWVGSDASPPTQERNFYAFPAKIQLERQSLTVNGMPIPLQSGMALSCSILVRKRPVLSIVTDLFDKQVKSLESIR